MKRRKTIGLLFSALFNLVIAVVGISLGDNLELRELFMVYALISVLSFIMICIIVAVLKVGVLFILVSIVSPICSFAIVVALYNRIEVLPDEYFVALVFITYAFLSFIVYADAIKTWYEKKKPKDPFAYLKNVEPKQDPLRHIFGEYGNYD